MRHGKKSTKIECKAIKVVSQIVGKNPSDSSYQIYIIYWANLLKYELSGADNLILITNIIFRCKAGGNKNEQWMRMKMSQCQEFNKFFILIFKSWEEKFV